MFNNNFVPVWTVRTYYFLDRFHIEVKSSEDALAAGDRVLAGKMPGAGLKVATELFRAAGLGVYNIYDRMNGRISLDRIRFLCEVFLDPSLHGGPWDPVPPV